MRNYAASFYPQKATIWKGYSRNEGGVIVIDYTKYHVRSRFRFSDLVTADYAGLHYHTLVSMVTPDYGQIDDLDSVTIDTSNVHVKLGWDEENEWPPYDATQIRAVERVIDLSGRVHHWRLSAR